MKTLRYGWHGCLFLIILFLTVLPVRGGVSDTFRRLTLQEGLSDLVVNAIYKDSMGYVWLGTNTSLDRYDGVRLKNYPLRGQYESKKRVYAVAETAGHVIWAGTSTGLWRLGSQDVLEQVAPEPIGCPVHALLAVGGDTLYIGSDQGIYRYADGKFQHYLFDQNILSRRNKVTALARAADGTLWAATDDGVGRIAPADGAVSFFPSDVALTSIACVDAAVFVGSSSLGLLELGPDGRFLPSADVGCTVVSALTVSADGWLYVATDGNGVHVVSPADRRVVRSYRHEAGNLEGIRSNSVYSLLLDNNGLLWAGLYQLGVDYTAYRSHQFGIFRWDDRFHTDGLSIRTLTFRHRQKLIGSRDGLFFIDEHRQQLYTFGKPQLRSTLILSSGYYQDRYYIGTFGGGLYVLDPETCQLTDFDTTLQRPFVRGDVFCIVPDAEGRLWIGTSDGLFCYRGQELLAHYTSANSRLPEGNVYEVFFDSTRKGWVCTETGMCLWDPSSQTLKTDVFPEGFLHREKVRAVYETSDHQLYFLPEKGPLFVSDLSMQQFRRLPPELMGNRSLLAIIEGRGGWLWIATSNGIYHFDRQERCIPYHFAHGDISPTFINSSPVRDADGRLWFGNSRGLVYVDDAATDELQVRGLRPVVSQVLVNGSDCSTCVWRQGVLERVRLSRTYGNLTFLLSGLTYSDVSNLSFEYRLAGDDEGWQPLTRPSEISLYDLAPGGYRLLVRRAGIPETETAVIIEVAVPLLHRLLVLLACSLALALAGWAVWKLRWGKWFGKVEESPRTLEEPVPVAVPVPAPERPEVAVGDVEDAGTGPVAVPEVLEEPAGGAPSEEKYRTSKISPEECRRLMKLLDQEMRRNRPYANPNLKIAELAERIGTTAPVLSYVFNQHLQSSYYDYINDFRVEEFKRLVEKHGTDKYTLSALAAECGFNSRASFFRYFKKVTGVTPSDYVKQLGKGVG